MVRHRSLCESAHDVGQELFVDLPRGERVTRLIHVPLQDHLVCKEGGRPLTRGV